MTKHAELASAFNDIYFYEFSYDGAPGNISVHYDGAESVGHTEELSYLFCSSILGCSFSEFTECDTLTSQRLITLWTNFAKYQ